MESYIRLVEEYLARGGKVHKCPEVRHKAQPIPKSKKPSAHMKRFYRQKRGSK